MQLGRIIHSFLQLPARLKLLLLASGIFFILVFTYCALVSNTPSYYVFDETYYVTSASEIGSQAALSNWEHPPLGKLFISVGRQLSSNPVSGARLPSLLFGFLTVVLVSVIFYLILPRLKKHFSMLPGLFLSLDPLFLNFSKLAMLDIFALFFQCSLMTIAVYSMKRRVLHPFYFAILSGLCLASKWSTLPIVLISWVFLTPHWRSSFHHSSRLTALLVLGATYFSTYLPLLSQITLKDVLLLQGRMLDYHLTFSNDSIYSSSCWSWLSLYKPIWLDFSKRANHIQALFAVSNPVLHFSSLLTIPLIIIRLWLHPTKRGSDLYLIFLFFGQFLLFAFSGRQVTFFHYYLPLIPISYLCLALSLSRLKSYLWAIGLATFAGLFFAFLSPFVFYKTLDPSEFRSRILFKSWLYLIQQE